MNDPFYPFTLYCRDIGNSTMSPSAFRALFDKTRPKGLSWFCYDVVVLSARGVVFHVYDEHSNFHGGKGKLIATLVAEAPVPHKVLLDRAIDCAMERRERELQAAEAEITARYADVFLQEATA